MAWLSLLIFIPVVGAIAVGWGCSGREILARRVALGIHGLVLAVSLGIAVGFEPAAPGMQYVERRIWAPSLGVEYHLGIDGLGLVAVLLAGTIPLLAAALSEHATRGRGALYHSLLLLLQAGLLGTFTALNFFHWFLFWELSLVPAYLLVRLFGGTGAGPASFQFFLYTMVGSVALLLAFLALRAAGGSFDFVELATLGRSGRLADQLAAAVPWTRGVASGPTLAWLVFGGVMLGLAIKVPLWPLHTWLPDTYTQAPSPVTMVLTGVMSKMGVYGLLRIAWPIFPNQVQEAFPILVLLGIATILLPTLAAFAQRDLKRILAYSSINHLGYCLLGIFAIGQPARNAPWLDAVAAPALNGVLLQMLNHGLTAATLFACVELLERRTNGVRDLTQFGGLRRAAPVFCGLMGISVFASVGLPGLNGFVSEFLIFKGVFSTAPWVAAISVFGLLATAIFLLTVLQKVFHGPLDSVWAGFRDLSGGERILLAIPVGCMFLLGIFPDLVLRLTNPTVLRLAGGP